MKFMIDSSNIEDIKRIQSLGITDGITSNPSILFKNGGKRFEQLTKISKITKEDIYVQLYGKSEDEMYNDYLDVVKHMKNLFASYVIKVPINSIGLKVIKRIKNDYPNERFLGTAIYTYHQGVLAILAGCESIAVYYNRILIDETHPNNPNEVIALLRDYIDDSASKTFILGASFKSIKHVNEAIQFGAHSCTLAPNLFDELLDDSRVERDFKKFNEDSLCILDE